MGWETATAWEQLPNASIPSPSGLLYWVKGNCILEKGARRYPLVETGGDPRESQQKT